MSWKRLTDAHWEKVRSELPVRKIPRRKKDRKGGRPRENDRKCFEGILVDFMERIAVERIAQGIWNQQYSPSSLRRVGGKWNTGELMARFFI